MKNRFRTILAVALAAVTLAATAGAAPAGAKPKSPTTTTTTSSSTTTTTTATTSSPYTNRRVVDFSATDWWQAFGLTAAPWHTVRVNEGTGPQLRVAFPKGTHNGTSWFLPTGASDVAHLRYRIKLSPNWSSAAGGQVKLPGFGNPVFSSPGVCAEGCGGMPANGITSYSARGNMDWQSTPGNYVYAGDMAQTVPTYGHAFSWWLAKPYVTGRWYTVDVTIKMNTPGVANGRLAASIDGTPVFDYDKFTFRKTDSLHVGNFWFDFYYGGTGVTPADMYIDIDDVLVEW